MDEDINLQNLRNPWNQTTDDSFKCWWKGTIFIQNNLMGKDDLRDFFVSKNIDPVHDAAEIIKVLRQLNGSFAIVLQTANYVLCIVDRIRSIPLFYSSIDAHLIISDDAHYLQERLHAPFNQEQGVEFLVTGYVTGTDTLFEGIQQIQAGEYLVYNKSEGNCSVHRYFQYIHENYSDEPEEQLIERLDDVMVGIFNRLIASTVNQGKPIVVPLSGGLDSRLVVAMLKRLGVDNVICFSYGSKGNRQAEISRQIADTLGYTWYYVEYTKKGWYDCCHSDEMQKYEEYAGNLTSVPYNQDYIAVKVLKEEGKIPENAVFVPGHTGDMISGGHIPKNIREIPANYEEFLNYTMQRHYGLWKWRKNGDYEITSFLRKRIQKSAGDVSIHDTESFANAIEYFNFNQRQAKWIVNSVRLYEFFGYEWRIPLWDIRLMDFFLKIPFKFRINQYLYIKYALDCVFIGNLEDLRRIECTTPIQNKGKIFSPYEILKKLSNFFHSFSYGVACTEKYPMFSRIRDLTFGHPFRGFSKYPILYEILEYSHKNKFKPPGNGISTLRYLTRIIN